MPPPQHIEVNGILFVLPTALIPLDNPQKNVNSFLRNYVFGSGENCGRQRGVLVFMYQNLDKITAIYTEVRESVSWNKKRRSTVKRENFIGFFFYSVQFKCKNMKKTEMLYGRHSHNNSQRDDWLYHCVYTPAAAPNLRQTIHHNRHVLLTSVKWTLHYCADFKSLTFHSCNYCIYDCIIVCIYVHLGV